MKTRIIVVLFSALAGSVLSIPGQTIGAVAAMNSFTADDPRLQLLGQIDQGNPKHPRLGYPGTGLRLRFQGSSLSLHLSTDSDKSALTVVIDHGDPALQLLQKGDQTLVLTRGLEQAPHTAKVYKRTETWQGLLPCSASNCRKRAHCFRLLHCQQENSCLLETRSPVGPVWRITLLAHPTPNTRPATPITVMEWNSAVDWMRKLTWFVMEAGDSIATTAD